MASRLPHPGTTKRHPPPVPSPPRAGLWSHPSTPRPVPTMYRMLLAAGWTLVRRSLWTRTQSSTNALSVMLGRAADCPAAALSAGHKASTAAHGLMAPAAGASPDGPLPEPSPAGNRARIPPPRKGALCGREGSGGRAGASLSRWAVARWQERRRRPPPWCCRRCSRWWSRWCWCSASSLSCPGCSGEAGGSAGLRGAAGPAPAITIPVSTAEVRSCGGARGCAAVGVPCGSRPLSRGRAGGGGAEVEGTPPRSGEGCAWSGGRRWVLHTACEGGGLVIQRRAGVCALSSSS